MYSKIRFYGYKLLHGVYRPFSPDKFKQFLKEELEIKRSDTVFVHSSAQKLNINFSPHKVIEILQEVVGPEGTVAFPCWHFNYRAEEYLENRQNVFNVKKSPTVMGLLPELARRKKDSFRSLHPTSSVVAIGKNAEQLINHHHLSDYPCDRNSPFYRIMDYQGKIIGLGEKPENSLSFIHCVEDELKDSFPVKTRTDKIYEGRVMDWSGKEIKVKTRAAHKNIQRRDIKGFFKKYIKKEECRAFRKKGTWFFVADSEKLYAKLKNLGLKGKTVYY